MSYLPLQCLFYYHFTQTQHPTQLMDTAIRFLLNLSVQLVSLFNRQFAQILIFAVLSQDIGKLCITQSRFLIDFETFILIFFLRKTNKICHRWEIVFDNLNIKCSRISLIALDNFIITTPWLFFQSGNHSGF